METALLGATVPAKLRKEPLRKRKDVDGRDVASEGQEWYLEFQVLGPGLGAGGRCRSFLGFRVHRNSPEFGEEDGGGRCARHIGSGAGRGWRQPTLRPAMDAGA